MESEVPTSVPKQQTDKYNGRVENNFFIKTEHIFTKWQHLERERNVLGSYITFRLRDSMCDYFFQTGSWVVDFYQYFL